jgi:hypothetical protein
MFTSIHKTIITVFGLVSLGLTMAPNSYAHTPKDFKYNGQYYSAAVLDGAGNDRVIQITTTGRTEGGSYRTIHRQYAGSCGGNQYSFLGEHETNKLGVVIYFNKEMNKSTKPSILSTDSDAGKLVKAGFDAVCQ